MCLSPIWVEEEARERRKDETYLKIIIEIQDKIE